MNGKKDKWAGEVRIRIQEAVSICLLQMPVTLYLLEYTQIFVS